MKCGDCPEARTNPNDDEDIYYCPFDKDYAFHSGEECTHVEEFLRKREPFMFDWD